MPGAHVLIGFQIRYCSRQYFSGYFCTPRSWPPLFIFFIFLVSYVRSNAHNSRSSRSNERDLRTCMHDSITLVISTPFSTLVTPRDLFIFWRLSALTIHHWNGCHFSGVLPLVYQMTPRDLFIFSRRSALARPSEPVPFVFRSVTYTLSRWVHACEAIARPPYYTRGHQRTLRTSALPGLGDRYIRSSSVASCPP